MATGQLQGQAQAQQEVQQQQQRDYANALQQFQLGHQLEQEQRASTENYLNRALALAPQVDPSARPGFLSEGLTNIYNQSQAPSQFGLEQLGKLAAGSPGYHPFQFPPYQRPPVLAPPATSGQGPAPGQGTTPGAGPNSYAPGQPGSSPNGFGDLFSAYQQNPAQFAQQPPLSTEEQAAMAAQLQVPGMAAPPPGSYGQYPTGPNPTGGTIRGGLFGPQPSAPFGTGGPPPPGQPIPAPAGPGGLLEQAGVNSEVVQRALARQIHAQSVTATLAGASGSNPAGTVAPPEHHPEIPGLTGAGAAPGGMPAGPAAPPNPVPPSATIGTAPVTVAERPMLRLPGFSQPIPYGAVRPEEFTKAEVAYNQALDKLNNSDISDVMRAEVSRIASQRPYRHETPEDLQQLLSVTDQLRILGVGRGAGITGQRQRAQASKATAWHQLYTDVDRAVNNLPTNASPQDIIDTIQTVGRGEADNLIPMYVEGNYGGTEARKRLDRFTHDVVTDVFSRLPPDMQKRYFAHIADVAERAGETISLPASFVLNMSEADRKRLAQSQVRIDLTRRQGDDRISTANARLQLDKDRLTAQKAGLLGGSGAGGRRQLTATAELNANSKFYDRAHADLKSYISNKHNERAAKHYYEVKDKALLAGENEDAIIARLQKDPDPVVKHIAGLDLALLHYKHGFEGTLDTLKKQATQPVQPVPTGPVKNHGVPGAFQGQKVPMLVAGPDGKLHRMSFDPEARVTAYKNAGYDEPTARAKVRKEVQAAKNGR